RIEEILADISERLTIQQRARDDAYLTADFTSNANDRTAFNIDVEFLGDWPDLLRDAAIAAVEGLSDLIVGDIADFDLGDGTFVDDVAVNLELTEIDGPGGTLASAGPEFIRVDGDLPIFGTARFDMADAEALQASGAPVEQVQADVQQLVTHEVLHVLGFGTIWEGNASVPDLLVETEGGLRFTGPAATRAYAEVFPEIAAADPFSDLGVPVEEELGPGSARGHWDEGVFGDGDIMTPLFDSGEPLTQLTAASLADLGYEVAPEYLLA
ncbi:MAG: hypothetical protein AAF390_18880, partial [Pseudomonadota bacterium]